MDSRNDERVTFVFGVLSMKPTSVRYVPLVGKAALNRFF